MRNRLCWIAVGGLSFWLPAIVAAAALHQNVNLWTLNAVPLAGVVLLGAATWIGTKHMPEWGWVLAGIYILGPVAMLAPSVFLHAPSSANVPGENTWMFLFCLFPPMTFWMAVLNGMMFSVLIATLTLPFLAAYLRGQGLQSRPPLSHQRCSVRSFLICCAVLLVSFLANLCFGFSWTTG